MANVKISALPEYSGNPTGGYSVFNNSGETTTYKIKNQNLFGDTNTIGSAAKYPFVVGSGNTLNNILQVAIGYANVMTGGENRDGGLNANMIVGNNNSITDTYTSNVLIVGQNNNNGGWNSMVVGQGNTINYGLDGIVVGAGNSVAVEYGYVFGQGNNSTSQGGFLVGQGNTAQGYAISFEAPFIHGYNHTTIMSHGIAMLGGRYNQIIGIMYDADARPYYDAIIGGEYNYIGTYITGSTIVGSAFSSISGSSGTTKYSVINGGSGNTISSSSSAAIIGADNGYIDNSPNSQILGGLNNTINCEVPSVERFNTIIGGSGNTIFDTSDDQTLQTIIGSINTTFQNGVQRVVGIGLSGRTINDAGAGTTYVENLKAFRQIASGFYDNGSIPQAGYTIDLSNGDKQQITITGSAGNTNLYFTGNIPGGRLVLKVINTSTGDLGFADVAPRRWKIPAVYPSASPSATDVYVFESFDDQELWFVSQSKDLS